MENIKLIILVMAVALTGYGTLNAQQKNREDMNTDVPKISDFPVGNEDSWFSHLAIACNPQTNQNIWLEPVSDEEYTEAVK